MVLRGGGHADHVKKAQTAVLVLPLNDCDAGTVQLLD